MPLPNIGIHPIKVKNNKAVIFRYSGWHRHYMLRNRPIEEWEKIERKLLDCGYDVCLLGYDDEMSNPNNLKDYRRKLSLYEVLDFTKDANICVTTTTFLYIWCQFVCPTIVLSDPKDVNNLNRFWRLHNNMRIVNVGTSNYLNVVNNYIDTICIGDLNVKTPYRNNIR